MRKTNCAVGVLWSDWLCGGSKYHNITTLYFSLPMAAGTNTPPHRQTPYYKSGDQMRSTIYHHL